MDSALSRLEAVTSRLEAIEARNSRNEADGKSSFTPPKFAVPLPGLATPGRQAPASSAATGGDVLALWDSNVQPALSDFMATAEQLDSGVATTSRIVQEAFQAERSLVEAIKQCKKPDDAALQTFVAPVGSAMQSASTLAGDRRSATFNHNKVVAEALQSLSWVVYSGPDSGMNPPSQHIDEAWQSAEFYANKILTEFRNKEPRHVTWVKQLKELLMKMKAHVQTYHHSGAAWNPEGIPLSQFQPGKQGQSAAAGGKSATASASPAKTSKSGGGPPPPPPPPPAGSLLKERLESSQAPAAPGFSAVLSAISNKGEGVTSGLKRVTADMKTKNRTDRTGVVPAAAGSSAAPSQATSQPMSNGAKPRTECEQGRKWVVEHHSGKQGILIGDTTPKQTVYIYRCSNSTIQIKGKVNAITIDQCKKVGVVFESLVASCELVNSSNLQIQTTGVMPTLAIDKCDGVQLFLANESLGTSILTAKSSGVNVLIPGKEGGDMKELYLPEQFVSTIKGGELVTEAVAHSG